jgi:SAM-dependent methyltransferase
MPIDYRASSATLSQREAFARSRLARTYRGLLDRTLLDLVGEAASLIDVGCGEAIFLEKLARSGRRAFTVGLDLHPENAVITRRLGFAAVRADAVRLPVAERTFEVALLTTMLEHVDDPLAALKEARRVLVPGGLAVVLVPHEDNFRRARTLLGRREEARLDYGHVNVFTPSSLRTLVRQAGLEAQRSRTLPLPWWFGALHLLVTGRCPR